MPIHQEKELVLKYQGADKPYAVLVVITLRWIRGGGSYLGGRVCTLPHVLGNCLYPNQAFNTLSNSQPQTPNFIAGHQRPLVRGH